jgi:hypothetical protein
VDATWIVELYRTGSLSTVLYDRVKHAWLDDCGRVLVIAQYINGTSGPHRYAVWRTERLDWYRMVRSRDAKEGR